MNCMYCVLKEKVEWGMCELILVINLYYELIKLFIFFSKWNCAPYCKKHICALINIRCKKKKVKNCLCFNISKSNGNGQMCRYHKIVLNLIMPDFFFYKRELIITKWSPKIWNFNSIEIEPCNNLLEFPWVPIVPHC